MDTKWLNGALCILAAAIAVLVLVGCDIRIPAVAFCVLTCLRCFAEATRRPDAAAVEVVERACRDWHNAQKPDREEEIRLIERVCREYLSGAEMKQSD